MENVSHNTSWSVTDQHDHQDQNNTLHQQTEMNYPGPSYNLGSIETQGHEQETKPWENDPEFWKLPPAEQYRQAVQFEESKVPVSDFNRVSHDQQYQHVSREYTYQQESTPTNQRDSDELWTQQQLPRPMMPANIESHAQPDFHSSQQVDFQSSESGMTGTRKNESSGDHPKSSFPSMAEEQSLLRQAEMRPIAVNLGGVEPIKEVSNVASELISSGIPTMEKHITMSTPQGGGNSEYNQPRTKRDQPQMTDRGLPSHQSHPTDRDNSVDSGYIKQRLTAGGSDGEVLESPEPNIESEEEETQRQQFARKMSSRNEIRSLDMVRSSQRSFKNGINCTTQPPTLGGTFFSNQHRSTAYAQHQMPPQAPNALPSNALVFTMPPGGHLMSTDIKKQRAASQHDNSRITLQNQPSSHHNPYDPMDTSHDPVQAFIAEDPREEKSPSRQDRSSEWLGNFADDDGDSHKSQVIQKLSSRVLFMQTMFKVVDLVDYHSTEKTSKEVAFNLWKSKTPFDSYKSQRKVFREKDSQTVPIPTYSSEAQTDPPPEPEMSSELVMMYEIVPPLQQPKLDLVLEEATLTEEEMEEKKLIEETKKADSVERMDISLANDVMERLKGKFIELEQYLPQHTPLFNRISADLDEATSLIWTFCDKLNEARWDTLSRVQMLEQIEVKLFERELQLEHREKETESLESQLSNLKLTYESNLNAQPLVQKKSGGTQTDVRASDLVQKEQLAEKLQDQASLKNFQIKEKLDLAEQNLQRRTRELDLRENQMRSVERQTKAIQFELRKRQSRQMQYPMSCLDSPEQLTAYIERVQQEIAEELRAEDHGLDSPVKMRDDDPLNMIEFKRFLQQQKNRVFMTNTIKMFKYIIKNKNQFKEQQIMKSFHTKATNIMKVEYKLLKMLAKVKIVHDELTAERNLLNMKMKEVSELEFQQDLVKYNEKQLTAEIDAFNSRQSKFRELVNQISKNHEIMVNELMFESLPKVANFYQTTYFCKFKNALSQFKAESTSPYRRFSPDNFKEVSQMLDSRGASQFNGGSKRNQSPAGKPSQSKRIEETLSNMEAIQHVLVDKSVLQTVPPQIDQTPVKSQGPYSIHDFAETNPLRMNLKPDSGIRSGHIQTTQVVQYNDLLQKKEDNIEKLKEALRSHAQHLEAGAQEVNLNHDIRWDSATSKKQLNQLLSFEEGDLRKLKQHRSVGRNDGSASRTLDAQERATLTAASNRQGLPPRGGSAVRYKDEPTMAMIDGASPNSKSPHSPRSASKSGGSPSIKGGYMGRTTKGSYEKQLLQSNQPDFVQSLREPHFQPQRNHSEAPLERKENWGRQVNKSRSRGKSKGSQATLPDPEQRYLELSEEYEYQIKILNMVQSNLQIEREFVAKQRVDYEQQKEELKQAREDLKVMDAEMNQAKLKMLIKFDKIKFLEDNYNQRKHRELRERYGDHLAEEDYEKKYIKLDNEIDDVELSRLSEEIFVATAKKVQANQRTEHWALMGVRAILKALLRQRKQSRENRLRYNFMLFRLQTRVSGVEADLLRREKLLETSQKLQIKRDIQAEREHLMHDMTLTQAELGDRIMYQDIRLWELESKYWSKINKQGLPFTLGADGDIDIGLTGRQLIIQVKRFHMFRERTILKLAFLHHRRRARLLLYFGFQQYKTQTFKGIIHDFIKLQEMGLRPKDEHQPPLMLPSAIPMQISDDSVTQMNVLNSQFKNTASQDELLDQVFGKKSPEEESARFEQARPRTKTAFTEHRPRNLEAPYQGIAPDTASGESTPVLKRAQSSNLLGLMSNEVQIRFRQRALILINIMTKVKKDNKLKRQKAFSKWKNDCISQLMDEVYAREDVQQQELQRIKKVQAEAVMQFSEQKSELQTKIQKMALLISERLVQCSNQQH